MFLMPMKIYAKDAPIYPSIIRQVYHPRLVYACDHQCLLNPLEKMEKIFMPFLDIQDLSIEAYDHDG